jgi:hypothetical protein
MPTGSIKVLIGTPCPGGVITSNFAHSLLETQRAFDKRELLLELTLLPGESLMARGRNALLGVVLDRPDLTHLLFIDADTGWRSEQVLRMLDFDRDVVCGLRPVKTLDWERVRANAAKGVEDLEASSLDYGMGDGKADVSGGPILAEKGFTRAEDAEAGFMLIKRQVLDRMRDAYPETRCVLVGPPSGIPRSTHAFFGSEIDPETGVYRGEGFGFYRRWRALGGEIWVDLVGRLDHIGSLTFHGDFRTQMQQVDPKSQGSGP